MKEEEEQKREGEDRGVGGQNGSRGGKEERGVGRREEKRRRGVE